MNANSKNKTTERTSWPWEAHYPQDIKWDADIQARPVYEMLEQNCREYGGCPAFDFLGKKWTWTEIGALVTRMAAGLQKQGVEKGTHVGLFLPNSPYYLVAYYAVLRAGGTVVNFNPLYSESELAHQVEDSETSFMITLDLKLLYDKMHKMLHETRLEKLVICRFTDILPFPKNILFRAVKGNEIAKIEHPERCIWFDQLVKNDDDPVLYPVDVKTDVAVIQYTGGTTGVPKGAMLTHENVTANTEQSLLWFYKAEKGKEKMLGVLPFFHVFAMTAVMNLAVRCAFEIVAFPRFDLKEVLKIIDKKKPHYFPAVPSIYSAINNFPGRARYDLKSLRFCISGGAPLPVEVKKTFEDHTGCVVIEGYGLSETSPVVCANPLEGENKPGSIGMPVPGTIIALMDMENQDKPVPIKKGERGELCVKGPQVMKGYWNKPEDTKKTLQDGWLRTGDVAVMDEAGYFFIVDRIKDMIITNGYNVYPRNIEEVIYLHPNVEECIVAGLPDKARGEIVKAWIKPKEGCLLTVEDIKAFLEGRLSKMEMPRKLEIRNEPLPKTMIGKLSRKDIVAEEQGNKKD